MIANPTNKLMNTATDNARGFQSQPQNRQHNDDRANPVDQSAVLNGRKFFIGDRHCAGQPYAGLIFLRKLQIGGGLANGLARSLTRLERSKIQDRANFNKPPRITGASWLATQHGLP